MAEERQLQIIYAPMTAQILRIKRLVIRLSFSHFLVLLNSSAHTKFDNVLPRAFYLQSKEWNPVFFSNIMPRDELLQILQIVRFDQKKTEQTKRLCNEKFAMISEIWNQIMHNSQCCYKPHESISIGEQLFPTKSRCKFSQYMPNKPHKVGINFGWQQMFNINALLQPSSLGEFVVLKLAEVHIFIKAET